MIENKEAEPKTLRESIVQKIKDRECSGYISSQLNSSLERSTKEYPLKRKRCRDLSVAVKHLPQSDSEDSADDGAPGNSDNSKDSKRADYQSW